MTTRTEIEPDGYESGRRRVQGPPPYESHYGVNGTAYAWGKTARLLTEQQLLQSLADTEGSFFAVDLCSSFPYYKQMMDGRHKERSRETAKSTVGAFIDQAIYVNTADNPIIAMRDIPPKTAREIRDTLGPKKSRSREFLHKAIFDIIVSPTITSNPKADRQTIKQRLLNAFHNSTLVELVLLEPSGKRGDKGNWQFITSVDVGLTLAQELATYTDGAAIDPFLEGAADHIANLLAGNLRRETYISFDIRDLKELAEDANYCWPERVINTRFFDSAKKDKSRHIKAAINAIPFRDGSISFVSGIEGWPFYFGDQTLDDKIKFANDITRTLKPGGKAVFVPFEVMRQELDTTTNMKQQAEELETTIALWQKQGLIVERKGYTHKELMDQMSDRELLLTDHSPVFKRGNGILTVLTLTKPKAT